jgi:hypothetical protein
MALFKNEEKANISKSESDGVNAPSILIILPVCYGNFNNISTFCRDCDIKDRCKRIIPPKEPLWCNNP